LIWSGVIEVGAITLVFITDSNVLRAIGGWSMWAVNLVCIGLIIMANDSCESDAFTPTLVLHSVGLGLAIGIFIESFTSGKQSELAGFLCCSGGTKAEGGAQEPGMGQYHFKVGDNSDSVQESSLQQV
jgi:hypothetical protein